MNFQDLRELLLARPEFAERRRMLVFKDLYFKPTDEKIEEGFRYFDCELEHLLAAFRRRAVDKMVTLPFSLDEDGDPDTSDVCLLVYYTESGSVVALQPQQYQDDRPRNAAEALVLEGDMARSVLASVRVLDQTR